METKQLTIKKSLNALAPVVYDIEAVVTECMPIALSKDQKIGEALVLAEGIMRLREIFYNNQEIENRILSMTNSKLGFMTDRSPSALASNSKIKPYSYEEIAECCIEALMKGYRLTDNEFNIIAKNMYPAKNGKYRLIIETSGLTEFEFGTTAPVYKTEKRKEYEKMVEVQYAEIRGFASWKIHGTKRAIGGEYGTPQIFEIKVNNRMGDDAIVGKALSKLFTRVLLMTRNIIVPESTDVDTADDSTVIDLKTESEVVEEQLKSKEQVEPAPPNSKVKEIIKFFAEHKIDELELCAYIGIDKLEDITEEGIKKLRDIGNDIGLKQKTPSDFKKEAAEAFTKRMKEKDGTQKK